MSVRNSAQAITLTSIDSSTFSASYQVINTAGLDHACFLIRIVNNSNEDITVSYDGSTNHEFVPKTQTLQLPLQANGRPNNDICLFPKGLKVYVKGTAGTGLVYLAGYYQI